MNQEKRRAPASKDGWPNGIARNARRVLNDGESTSAAKWLSLLQSK